MGLFRPKDDRRVFMAYQEFSSDMPIPLKPSCCGWTLQQATCQSPCNLRSWPQRAERQAIWEDLEQEHQSIDNRRRSTILRSIPQSSLSCFTPEEICY